MFKIETPDDVTTLVRRVAEHTNLPVRIVAHVIVAAMDLTREQGDTAEAKGQVDLFDPKTEQDRQKQAA